MKSIITLAGIVSCLSQPVIGPYETTRTTLPCDALDGTDPEVMLTYPIPTKDGEVFPLIAYAHGAAGGGLFINGYDDFFHQIASYGFVIAAHKSCAMGAYIDANQLLVINTQAVSNLVAKTNGLNAQMMSKLCLRMDGRLTLVKR